MGIFDVFNIKPKENDIADGKQISLQPKFGNMPISTVSLPTLNTADGGQPQEEIHTQSYGTTGTQFFGGFESEEYLNELKGRNAPIRFDEMVRMDATVYSSIQRAKDKVKSAKYYIEPENEDNEEESVHAKIASKCFFELQEKLWLDNLNDVLTYFDKGHSVFEPVWEEYDYPQEGKIWKVRKLGWKSQKTLWQWYMLNDGIWCIRQISYGDDSRYVDIPGENVLVFTYNREGNLFQGRSPLRAMYGAVKRKNEYLVTALQGVKSNAKGVIIVDVPDKKTGSAEYNNLIAALTNFWKGFTSWITKPFGWNLTHVPMNFQAEKIAQLLSYEDMQISLAGGSDQSQLGQTTRGAQGLHSGKQAESDITIKVQAEYICAVFQKLVNDFYIYNWGKDAKPGKLCFTGIDNKPNLEEAQKDAVLATIMPELNQDPIYKAYMRKKYDIPGGDEIEEVGDLNGDGKIDDKDVELANRNKSVDSNDDNTPPDNGGSKPNGEISKEVKEHGALIKQIIADTKVGKEKNVDAYAAEIVKAHTKLKEGCACGNHNHPQRLSEFKLKREPNKYESKVMLSELSGHITSFTAKYNTEIQNSFINFILPKYKKDLTNALTSAITDAQKYNAVIDTTLEKSGKVKSLIKSMLTEQTSKGYVQAKAEVKNNTKLAEPIKKVSDLPAGAYGWIAANAEILTDTLFDDVKKKLVLTAINGIDNSKTVEQIVFDAIEEAEDYIDKDKNIGAQYIGVKALNEGRFSAFQEAKDEIQGFQFSAILETACPLCEELDGKTFKIDDPDSVEYTPPLHPNCNCILIPILNDEEEPETWNGLDAAAEKEFDSDEIEKYKKLKENK